MDKKIEVTIKKVTSSEPNVSARHVTYDVYHNGKYHKTFNDVNDAVDHKEKMHNEQVELDETLSIEQRRKRGQVMRAHHTKIERAREIAQRKLAAEKNLRKRAFQMARSIMRKKLAGQHGAEYAQLGPSEKVAIDRMLDGKGKAIKKLALRLMPKVKKAEYERLQSYLHGQSMQNMGAEEGHAMKEDINDLFNEAFASPFPQDPNRPISGSPNSTMNSGLGSKPRVAKDGGKSNNDNIEFHTKKITEALDRKSDQSGIDFDVLAEVFTRGLEAWNENSKVTQEQYAFARVNSYINQGKTYFNEDADLHELSVKTLQSWKDQADNRDTTLATNKIRKANKAKEFFTKTGTMTNVPPKVGASNPVRTKRSKSTPSLYDHTEISVAADLHELSVKTLQSWKDQADNRDTLLATNKIRKANKAKDFYTQSGLMTDKGPKVAATSPTKAPRKKITPSLYDHYEIEDTDLNEEKTVKACWKGYKAVGFKQKRGKRVPNCVPEQVEVETTESSKNSKARKKIEKVDRAAPHTELGKQGEIITKIIEQTGNKINDPKKRLQGTDSLRKAYQADTPGQDINESFNIAFAAGVGVTLTAADLGMRAQGGFAYHPSVIDQIEENAVTADRQPVIMPAHRDAYGNTIPAKTVMRKTSRKILDTGNTHDGEPN
jgi:hypothetical protein